MQSLVRAAFAVGLLGMYGCSSLALPRPPTPSQSPESEQAAVLAAAAAPLVNSAAGVVYVLDSFSAGSPEAANIQGPSPTLGAPLTPLARAAISAAFDNGPEFHFVHDPSTIVDGWSMGGNGCRHYLGTLVTFSTTVRQPDGTYQVARYESSGCSGSAYLLEVAYVDGRFQVTSSRQVGGWIV